jgi:preprotein translocase subunit SecG
MLSLLITFLLAIHVLVSLLIIFIVLMQRPKSEGLGAAFGGGMTENLFGAQTSNVLANFTRWLGGIFFILTLILSILYAKLSTQRSAIQAAAIRAAAAAAAAKPSASPAFGTPALAGTAALSGSASSLLSGSEVKLFPAATPPNSLFPASTPSDSVLPGATPTPAASPSPTGSGASH